MPLPRWLEPRRAADGPRPAGSRSTRRRFSRSRLPQFRIRRSTKWLLAAGSGVILVVLGVLTGVALLAAQRADRQGLALIQAARSGLRSPASSLGSAAQPLSRAARDFDRADRRLSRWWVDPVRSIPFLGRQIDTVRTLSATAATVARIGSHAVTSAAATLQAPHRSPSERLVALNQLGAISAEACRQLGGLRYGSGSGLVSPLATARSKLIAEVSQGRRELCDVALAASVTNRVLGGDTSYLLLEANNAEMRAGSGMYLRAGLLETHDGAVTSGPTVPTAELSLPPGRVPIGGDLQARWGWLHPSQDWRNLATTPQFDVTAELASKMWQASGHQPPGGVISIDDVAVADLLGATGPLMVDGQRFSAGNVVAFLTEGQYDQPDQSLRRDLLGDLSHAALQALDSGPVSIARLSSGLADAASGRHLMLWSPDRSVEASYDSLGVSGRIAADDVALDVLNAGGDKLDPYLRVTASLGVKRGRRPLATLRVTLTNSAPASLPPYVTGVSTGATSSLGEQSGGYAGLIALDLPGGSSGGRIVGQPLLAAAGPEGPLTLMAVPFRLDRGHNLTYTVEFYLPSTHGQLVVTPSTRVPPVRWNTPAGSFDDTRPHTIGY